MRLHFALAAVTAALLAGCSAAENASDPSPSMAETAGAEFTSGSRSRDGGAPETVKVSVPQLAYSYTLAYLLPGDRIATSQNAHRALCEDMGPARCQLLAFEHGAGNEASTSATLKLRVATAEARRFQVLLDQSVTQAGGRIENASIAAEDLSKQIVDTEARIRQRELLVARLTEALRNRKGTPAELVDAERSVTQAQEELDQARAWLAENRGRVAMSEFTIRYGAIAPSASTGNFGAQLSEALQGSGAVFLIGLRTLLSIAIYLLPWALLAIPVVLLVRRWRKRPMSAADV